MIIGHGSLAKLLKDREGAILFASGVGNSSCDDKEEFRREHAVLFETIHNNLEPCIFYFSSISVFFKQSPYHEHKELMEYVVKANAQHYNIIRLGNIWECTNPHTFRNYLNSKPNKLILDEYKYMIGKDQLNMIVQSLPLTGRNEISVFGEMKKVKECLIQ